MSVELKPSPGTLPAARASERGPSGASLLDLAALKARLHRAGNPPPVADRYLRWATAAWLAVALPTIILFVLALPSRHAELVQMARDLSPSQRLALADLGIDAASQVGLVFVVEIVVASVFFGIGLLLFWRRRDDWTALLVGLAMVTYAAWVTPPLRALVSSQPSFFLPVTLVQIVAMASTVTTFFVFPNGRFVPAWSRVVVICSTLWGIGWLMLPGSFLSLANPYHLPLGAFLGSMVWWVAGIGAQIYRYTRETSADHRRQTRLVVVALTIGVLAYLAFNVDRVAQPFLASPREDSIVYDLVGVPVVLTMAMLIPLACAASILRYRLWEIDGLLSQAVVYGALTAIVAGLYPASLDAASRLFIAVTGENSDLAAAAATLLFALLLTPFKDAIERAVNRRLRPRDHLTGFAEQVHSVVELLDVEEVTRRALDEAIVSFGATGGAVYLLDRRYPWPLHARGAPDLGGGMTGWIEHAGVAYGWITLGPRGDGRVYSHHDLELFDSSLREVAKVIALSRKPGLDPAADTDPRRVTQVGADA